jgi:hypothetical protein
MSVTVTGDGPNISLTGSGSSFTITVTTGGGGGSSATERDIYRPALVMSPASVTAFGGSMVNGVSLTIAALASSIPVGQDVLVWNGTNGGAPNGSYTHAGSGTFNYSTRQYLNATSFLNGCVEVSSNDFATTGADGDISRWAITTVNGTDYGLTATGGQAFRLTYGPSSYTDGRPVVFEAGSGNWLKQGSEIGGQLASAANAGGARTVLGLGTSATYDVGTGTGNVITGNDSRLSDARTPTDGSVTNAKVNASAAIDLSKLQSIATGGLLGRVTAGTGPPERLTPTQVRALLGNPWVDLYDTTLGTDTASVQVTVTGYTLVRFSFLGRSTRNATLDTLRLTVNNNTTDSIYSTSTGALTAAGLSLNADMPGSSTNTNRMGTVSGELHFLPGYRPSGTGSGTSHGSTSTASGNTRIPGWEIATTATINTVEFFMALGSMAAGSRLIVSAR